MIRLQGIAHNFGLKSFFFLMQRTLMLSSKSLKTLEAAKRTFVKLPKVTVALSKLKTLRKDESWPPFP